MATTCPRHPDEETRLACSNCGTPICHRCAVQSAVGQKCPDCAQPPRASRPRGRPRQYAKAIAAGVVTAAVGAGLLAALVAGIGFFYLIGSGLIGYGVARAVSWGAEGNRTASAFRLVAYGLALLAVQGGWLILGVWLPTGFALLSYVAAVYGASIVYRW